MKTYNKYTDGEVSSELDVFVSNYTIVDPEIFQLYIEGYFPRDAVAILKQKSSPKTTSVHLELLASDVLDHYRVYSMLEPSIQNPTKLSEQLTFQLEAHNKYFLIEKYYSLDDTVVRELLGKKLSSGDRKNCDDISDKCGIRLKSVQRQFDNIKRIFKTVEELSGNIANNIKQHFLLPDELARKYAAVVFVGSVKFETTKKRLQYLDFNDFYDCSQAIMTFWTYTYQHSGPEYYDTEVDKEFIMDLRDLKCLLEREKEIKYLVLLRLKESLLDRLYSEMESNFCRVYLRPLVAVAVNMNRGVHIRTLFVDLAERIIDPWKQAHWNLDQVQVFLRALTQSILDLEVSRDQEIRCLWDRYMQVITACLIKMYNK